MTKRWLVRVAALAALGLSVGCQGFCNRHYPCPAPTCCAPCGAYTSAPPPPVPAAPVAGGWTQPRAMNCTCTPQ